MNNKSLLVLVVITLAAIAVAWSITAKRTPSTEIAKDVLYPDLINTLNTLAYAEIRDQDQVTELALRDQQWKVASADGYPAEISKVKDLVISIAELEILEEKTSLEERYARLGVENIDQQGAESRQVTLKDAAGATLASLIIGKRKTSSAPVRNSVPALYVRKTGTAGSLLVEGEVSASADPAGWWDDALIDIAADRIREIRVAHPGAEVIVFQREAFDGDFALAKMPAGKELKSAAVLGSMANALSNLSFDNVRSSAAVTLPADATVTTYSAFDGLVVTVTSGETDGLVLAIFSARFDPEIVVPPDAQASAEDADAAPATSGSVDPADSGDDSDSGIAAEEFTAQAITEEAAGLTERLQAWAFVLPRYKISLITKEIDDLVNDITPEENAEQ